MDSCRFLLSRQPLFLSNTKNLLSYFKCTHPDDRKAAVPPLYQSREGEAPSGAGGESV
jgi:hypothetical protein